MNDVKSSTDRIFESEMGANDLSVPVPPPLWKDKMDAFEASNLTSQRTSLIFDMRCWQAAEMGFRRIESGEMVQMLMGESHTATITSDSRQTYEWIYNHHDDKVQSESNWGGKPEIFQRIDRQGFWYMPPFANKIIWQCQFGKLNYLKRTIPYGVVLRIEECKKTKLFNAFNVLAPLEAWERKTDIDPIVVASVWEIVETEKSTSAGQVAHFFVAQW